MDYTAAMCRRGHLITPELEDQGPIGARCPACGAEVIAACPACGFRIPGRRGLAWFDEENLPDFCTGCGAAFPWVGRQGRIYELENRLAGADLDEATEIIVREQLRALANLRPDEMGEEAERKGWEQVKRLAPKLWDDTGFKAVATGVITEAMKRQIGL